MKKTISFLLSVIITFSMLSIPVQASEHTTPSGIKWKDIGTNIEYLEQENKGNYASFATAVFTDKEVLYDGYYGYIDRENLNLADENTVYEWGSISKLFVWISVMQLYEQGKLDLNADIRTYLPEGFFTKLKYDDPITMMNLMHHNAGWEETLSLMVDDEADLLPLEEALQKAEPVQVFRPGEITAYSNWGSALAGYIVERVSGMDYTQYVQLHILKPLGMEHTSISANYRDNPWVRQQREKNKSYLILSDETMGVLTDEELGTALSYFLLYPAGSVTGTLTDIIKLGQAFLDDTNPLFEKKETLELMLSASDFYGDSNIPKNCHGLWCTEYAVSTLGHGGNTNAGTANLVIDTEGKLGTVVLTNQQMESVFCYGIPKLIFGSIENNPIYQNATITKHVDISGNYMLSRGMFEGILKIYPALTYLTLHASEDPTVFTYAEEPLMVQFGDHLFRIPDTNDFFYATTTSDQTKILECSSMVYIQNQSVSNESAAVIILYIIAVTTLFLLFIKGVKKWMKEYQNTPAEKAILTGQLASLAIGAILLIIFTTETNNITLLMHLLRIVSGISIMASLISAICTVKTLFITKERNLITRMKYIGSTLCNLYVTGFIIYFRLFDFWT